MVFDGKAFLPLLLLSSSLLSAHAEAPLPDAIAAPGEATVLTVHAEGAQIYECRTGADGKPAWAFREPIATLLVDGKTVGRHYSGPNWEHSDGSAVVGKAAGNAPGATPNDIPWLKLEVISHRGSGILAAASSREPATRPAPSRARPTPPTMSSCARAERQARRLKRQGPGAKA
jgi:Protein of unknown function (DUF3455)